MNVPLNQIGRICTLAAMLVGSPLCQDQGFLEGVGGVAEMLLGERFVTYLEKFSKRDIAFFQDNKATLNKRDYSFMLLLTGAIMRKPEEERWQLYYKFMHSMCEETGLDSRSLVDLAKLQTEEIIRHAKI